MATIHMLDEDGAAIEEIEAHVCTGTDDCASAAICESHPNCVAASNNPVYVWNSENGLGYFMCQEAFLQDATVRLAA